MKHLTCAKRTVLVLLVISAIVAIIFLKKCFSPVSSNYEYGTRDMVILVVSLVQSVNFSIALYILSILDKHLMPVYS